MSSQVKPGQSAERQATANQDVASPLVLAIDSSSEWISIALWRDRLLLDKTWRSASNHTVELLPAVARMFGEARLTLDEVGVVAVSLGPGSFNGIRVGISTAKGLALALNCAIVGCSALETCAFESAQGPRAVRPVLLAGQGKLATALYSVSNDSWIELEAPRLLDISEVDSLTQGDWTVHGDVNRDGTVRLTKTEDTGDSEPLAEEKAGTAATLAHLAATWFQHGRVSDVSSLQPLYLRQPGVTIAKKPLQVVL